MKRALQIWAIRGIPLRPHWTFSLLLVFILLAPQRDPLARADATRWIAYLPRRATVP